MATVDRDKLVRLFVEAVPGQPLVGMRDCDLLETRIVEIRCGIARRALRAEAPVAVHRQELATGAAASKRLRKTFAIERERGECGAAGFDEFATFHVSGSWPRALLRRLRSDQWPFCWAKRRKKLSCFHSGRAGLSAILRVRPRRISSYLAAADLSTG